MDFNHRAQHDDFFSGKNHRRAHHGTMKTAYHHSPHSHAPVTPLKGHHHNHGRHDPVADLHKKLEGVSPDKMAQVVAQEVKATRDPGLRKALMVAGAEAMPDTYSRGQLKVAFQSDTSLARDMAHMDPKLFDTGNTNLTGLGQTGVLALKFGNSAGSAFAANLDATYMNTPMNLNNVAAPGINLGGQKVTIDENTKLASANTSSRKWATDGIIPDAPAPA